MFSRIRRAILEYREIRYLAYHDCLTGLFNRNWLYKNLSNINHKYVYFFDLNGLKQVNKNGHFAGDEYIKTVLGLVELKEDDILVRYAGDEFILFSNREHTLKTNTFFCVGCSENYGDIVESIKLADLKMVKEKEGIKTQKYIRV